jgi:uncharacterized membrane protein YidH (DUF202 family)
VTARRQGGPEPDLGLQAERTALAWTRTALACAGLAAVSLRLLDRRADLAAVLVLGAVVALPGLAAAWWRLRDLMAGEPHAPPRRSVALLALTIAVVDAGVLARMLA